MASKIRLPCHLCSYSPFCSLQVAFSLVQAMRPLHENPLLKKYFPGLALSLVGPVPPVHGSPPTHIPAGSGKGTTVNEMNFAGHRPPPAFSGKFIDSSVAA
ncbi:hypothetical protein Patl1_25212 [Pistacia atlantica]|uniref:Uncharacterized protein n=1 Tax=Pistacia atlantica TaxID=434234 RepID=A0ACC1B288_9ROSI|nr:hypothetical protein Patl1_25212 [Pistacia atlantica]